TINFTIDGFAKVVKQFDGFLAIAGTLLFEDTPLAETRSFSLKRLCRCYRLRGGEYPVCKLGSPVRQIEKAASGRHPKRRAAVLSLVHCRQFTLFHLTGEFLPKSVLSFSDYSKANGNRDRAGWGDSLAPGS